MRKALIGLLMAATAITPFAAQAQVSDADRQSHVERYERLEQQNQQRSQRRQEREAQPSQQAVQQERAERRAYRQQQAPAAALGTQQYNQQAPQYGQSQTDSAWQGDPNDPRMEAHRRRYERLEHQNRQEYGSDYRQDRRDDSSHYRGARGDYRQDYRDHYQDRRDRRWNRDWRRDTRYDWQRYRSYNRYAYRTSPYYAPYRNHRYSRFSIGIFLGNQFTNQRYWINDPWQYRLPAAGYGYQWVRYYNDVILVDRWSGEVVDVIYDFFW